MRYGIFEPLFLGPLLFFTYVNTILSAKYLIHHVVKLLMNCYFVESSFCL